MRRIRLSEQVLYDLVDYLKKQPLRGVAPKRTLIYASTFDPRPENAKYTAALAEFLRLAGPTALNLTAGKDFPREGLVRGYVDCAARRRRNWRSSAST